MPPLTILLRSCGGTLFDPVAFWGTVGLVWAITGFSCIAAVRLWARFAAFVSGLGCFGGFAVALLGMTGWTIAMAFVIGGIITLASWLVSTLRVWPPSQPDDIVLWLGPTAGLAAVCALVVESPPLRRLLWDHIEASARRTRVVLMTSLGLFGTLIIPSLGLLWVAYVLLTFTGNCDNQGW
jgi:hypothetical protein